MIYDLSNYFDISCVETKFKELVQKKSKIELKQIREKRTIKQNSYLHVCISLFAIYTGYTLEEAKTHLKRTCGFMVYEKNGERFLKKTSKLDTLELTKFIDWIRQYASDNGCYILSPDEYIQNQFEIDKEIEQNKYLI